MADRSRKRIGWLDRPGLANRLWYLFFGEGLSPSLEDFGGQGQPPSNRPLLDNLSVALIENGWSIKKTIRLIVTSRPIGKAPLSLPKMPVSIPRTNGSAGKPATVCPPR